MENDAVEDRHLERVILGYMEIPYFWNNPWYVGLWKRYYLLKKKVEIIFLMHGKEIGCLHAWIYLQLHKYFTEIGCSACAQLILEEGLKKKAHPITELEEKFVPEERRAGHLLEKPKKIRVFGREWLRKSKRAIPASILVVGGEELSLLECKLLQYARDKNIRIEEEAEKGLNEVSILFGSLRAEEPVVSAETAAPSAISNSPWISNESNVSIQIVNGLDLSSDSMPMFSDKKRRKKEEIESSEQVNKKGQSNEVFGFPDAGDKVVIHGFLYIIKKTMGRRTILATRIASLSSGNVTLNAKDYILRMATADEEKKEEVFVERLRNMGVCIPIEGIAVYADKKVFLCPFMEMGSLSQAVGLIKHKEGNLPEVLCAHYIKEILEIGQALSLKGVTICNCIADDFVLIVEEGRIILKLSSYSSLSLQEEENSWGSRVLDNPAISFLLFSCKQANSGGILLQQFPLRWIDRIRGYLSQKKESDELQNLFISQEVAIYEAE